MALCERNFTGLTGHDGQRFTVINDDNLVNLSAGLADIAELYRKEQQSAVFQIQVSNLADRVDVINFASLFSGTAVAPPRSVSARLRLTF